MEFREFVIAVAKNNTLINRLSEPYGYVNDRELAKMNAKELDELAIEESWISGGLTGGSCYSNDDHYAVDPSEPIDINPKLASVVEEFKPDTLMSYYFKTINPLIKNISYSKGEYYGNYYNYSRVYVNLRELYDVLFV